jgi:2-oxo-3-hexenedioate decarboxylase
MATLLDPTSNEQKFSKLTSAVIIGATTADRTRIWVRVYQEGKWSLVVTKAPLKGPGCHVGAVMAAIDFVIPAVEIIDSRYRDFKFDLKSVVADNTSASRFVIGGRSRHIEELDLRTLGVVLEKNGQVVAMAAGAAVLGHPAAAVAMLANHLGARGQEIPAGTFIMTGGVTEAIPVAAGDSILVRYQDLGSVSMRFV